MFGKWFHNHLLPYFVSGQGCRRVFFVQVGFTCRCVVCINFSNNCGIVSSNQRIKYFADSRLCGRGKMSRSCSCHQGSNVAAFGVIKLSAQCCKMRPFLVSCYCRKGCICLRTVCRHFPPPFLYQRIIYFFSAVELCRAL